MPLFLAGLLVRGGAVAPDVMEEALQRQVLYGGSLDTNLLEIGAIDEATLAPYLARASGLPLAPLEAFDAVEPRVRRAFPARLAERHGVVPFHLEGRTLEVACCYPVEGSLIDEISFMLSLILRPHVAFEFRVRLAVERLYGHTAAQRFHALATRFGVEVHPPEPDAPPPPPLPPPTAKAQAAVERHQEKADAARATPPSWTKDQALAMLDAATDRDAAIDIVLRFSRRVFEYTSAFVVVGGNVIGWDAIGPDPTARRRAAQVALPVDAPSILRTVVETGGRYLGPIPPDEHHLALLEALGRRPPRSAYLQPVSIGDRVVAVVFCDNGEKVVSPLQVSQVMQVVQRLSSSLQAMIVARKGALSEAEAVTPGPAAPVATAPVAAAPVAAEGLVTRRTITAPFAAVQAPPDEVTLPRAAPPVLTPVHAPPMLARVAPPVLTPVHAPPMLTRVAPPAHAPPGVQVSSRRTVTASFEAVRLPAPDDATPPAGFRVPPLRAPAPPPAVPVARPPDGLSSTERARRAVEALLSARAGVDREGALSAIEHAGAAAADVLVALLPGPGAGSLTREAASAPRSPLVQALALLGDSAVPALLRARNASSPAVRFWVAALLARSGTTAAREALSALAADPSPEVAALARG